MKRCKEKQNIYIYNNLGSELQTSDSFLQCIISEDQYYYVISQECLKTKFLKMLKTVSMFSYLYY